MAKRGLFVVFEGIDRCGKSTQVNLLAEYLRNSSKNVHVLRFPNRETPSGTLINSYLVNVNRYVDPHCLHLLFSANRWESQSLIENLLKSSTIVLCDRYSFSGVVYSMASHGLSSDFVTSPEIGLIEPDYIFYIGGQPSVFARRNDYGNERFENLEIQQRCEELYRKLLVGERCIQINGEDLKEHKILGIFGTIELRDLYHGKKSTKLSI